METFIHIPKTGGTSVVQILSNQILFKKFLRLNPTWDTHPKDFLSSVQERIDQVLKDAHNDVEVVGGHFGFGAHRELMDASKYFTVLRDPVERTISEYYYMRYNRMYYQELIKSENLKLEDYINHPDIQYLNNLQTRLVSGVSYDVGDDVTKVMFDQAVTNLRKFKVFGLTERMGESLALFYLKLGWKRMPYYLQSNANNQNPGRDKIPQSDIELILRRDQYDVRLYQVAQKLFDEMILKNQSEIDQIMCKVMRPNKAYKFYLKVLKRLV